MGLGKKTASFVLFFQLACTPLQGKTLYDSAYASKVLNSTNLVMEAEKSLGPQDSQLAKIRYQGNLDLELSDKVSGQDNVLEVFTQRLTTEFAFATMLYDVYGKEKANDEWTYLGSSGAGGKGIFFLQNLNNLGFVRIRYKNPYYFIRVPKVIDDVIGVDAVKAGQKD